MIWTAVSNLFTGGVDKAISSLDDLLTSSENKIALQQALNEGNPEVVAALSKERREAIAFAIESAKSTNPFVAGARPVMMWATTGLFTAFCFVALLSSLGYVTISNTALFEAVFETVAMFAFGLYGVRAIERRKKP